MKVFISYSRRDAAACEDLHRELKDHGHEVWLDHSDIAGGARWRASIENAIQDADAFVILLSPNVAKNPDYPLEELELARKNHKEIIPVVVKAVKELPPGFNLTLGGLQQVHLYKDWNQGVQRVLDVLGKAEVELVPAKPPLRERAGRSWRRTKSLMRDKEVAKKAGQLGAAALAGAAAIAVASKQANARTQEAETQVYRARVNEIFARCHEEFALASQMDPSAYVVEFRPNIQNLLGQLEGLLPMSSVWQDKHRALVQRLGSAVNEFDDAISRVGSGDEDAIRRALVRLNSRWSETLQSYADWLEADR